MLGRLARWLRVLGFDTAADASLHDRDLVRWADAEGRILLTRDRHLLRELRPRLALEIRHDAPLDQLRDVLTALGSPPPPGLFTRCTLCNGPLLRLAPGQDAAHLPQGLRDDPGPVWQCRDCGHVYWQGSHVRRMRTTLARALPQLVPPDVP